MSLPRNGMELGKSGIAANWQGVTHQQLKAIIEIYEQSIIFNRYEDDKEISSYEVSAKSLAVALSGVQMNSGLLPQNTIFTGSDGDNERIAIMIPAAKQRINAWQGGQVVSMDIPLPSMVLLGSGLDYWLFACKVSWPTENTDLFQAPLPNIYVSGKICQGSVPFPCASARSIHKAAKLLLESNFNKDLMQGKSRKHTTDVYALYKEIEGFDKYPMDDLVESRLTIGELMNADPARRV